MPDKKNTDKNTVKKYGKINRNKLNTVKKQNGENNKKAVSKKQDNRNIKKQSQLKISFLGGLNEIGKNLTVMEYGSSMIIIDCGLAFPDASMLGVDLVIPDFSYIEKNKSRLKGIFITHGHEDHIGAISYLVDKVETTVYSSKLTIGLIEGKLKETKKLSKAKLKVISAGSVTKAGDFSVEAIRMNHSIPDALAFAIKCEQGTVVHTGDYKIDPTPIDGKMADLARLGQLGNEGVLCLLSDSTNAERLGYTESEIIVGESFANLFRKAGRKRLIVATFSSNIHRVQQIINVASTLGRKVAFSGRSLENVVNISKDLGYLNVPDNIIVSIDTIRQYPDDKLVIITTGSQGEPMSALTRMAMSDHRKVSITPNDCVIISANPIPGNEKTVGNVINELMKLGADVVYEGMYDVHVSGHACQEEQKIIMGLVNPKFFIPVHGEQKHLQKHALTAEAMGINKKNIIITTNGTSVTFVNDKKVNIGDVPFGNVYVDGYGVGDVGSAVLRDRKLLSEDGIIIISVAVDTINRFLLTEPQINSKGFALSAGSDELFNVINNTVVNIVENYSFKSHDINMLSSKIKESVSKIITDRTRRNPIILPVITEV